MNKFKRSVLCPLFVTALVACSSDVMVDDSIVQDESINPDLKSATNHYQKPGAAIQFQHNYDGITEVGEVEQIQLQFEEQYQAGVLTITLSAQDDLLLVSNSISESFSLQSNENILVNVELKSMTAGRHYLHIFATISDVDGNDQTRSFAMALNVGDQSMNESQKSEATDKLNGEPVILLPATETIIQK